MEIKRGTGKVLLLCTRYVNEILSDDLKMKISKKLEEILLNFSVSSEILKQ